jgi:hypothetical protein
MGGKAIYLNEGPKAFSDLHAGKTGICQSIAKTILNNEI